MGMDFCKKISDSLLQFSVRKYPLESSFGINFTKMKKKIVLKTKIIVVVELIFHAISTSYLPYGKIFLQQ